MGTLLEEILEDTIEIIRAIDDQLSNIENVCPSLSDCQFPDHIEDPLLLLRILFGSRFVSELEYRDDAELVSELLYKWVQILRRAQNT